MSITGQNLTIRNCEFMGWFDANGADGLYMANCTSHIGNSLSGVFGASIIKCDFSGGDDLFHITRSNTRGHCENVLIEDCWFHDPTPQEGDHSDGLQVRGCWGLTIRRTNIDMGPWFRIFGTDVLNAALYIEADNDGNRDVVLEDVRLNGGGITFRYHLIGGAFVVKNVTIGPDWHYGMFTGSPAPTQQSGNTVEATGDPITFTASN